MSSLRLNPWFGEAPTKWQRGQLKRFYSVRLGKMLQPTKSSPRDELVPYMRAANVSWDGPDISDIKEMWAAPAEAVNIRLEIGDLLVSEGGDVGRSCLWRGEIPLCIFQNAINRVRSRGQNSTKFLLYVMRAVKGSGWIDIVCNKATIAHFTAEKLNALEIPLPSPTEQRSIAAYLDEQTAKIDRLMDMRRRQMALLKEQRAALIQQAVTCGLNPNAPMKDSGLPWLGEIPAHWEVVHLKRLLSLVEYGISERVDVEGKFICLRMGDLNFGEISYDGVAYVDSVEEGLLLRKGDLLFNRTNSLAQVGKVAIYRGNGDGNITFASYLVRLRTGCDADSEYLNYLLNSEPILVWARSEAIPAIGQANLNPTRYCLLRVVKPPIDEQKAIASYCLTTSRRVEDLLSAYARQLSILTEYRAALIHECVTGQRTLPEAANP